MSHITKSSPAEVEAGEEMSYPVVHSSFGCLVKGGLFIDHQQESRFSVWESGKHKQQVPTVPWYRIVVAWKSALTPFSLFLERETTLE